MSEQVTKFPAIGTRIVVANEGIDAYPDFGVANGATGTLVRLDEDSAWVKLDDDENLTGYGHDYLRQEFDCEVQVWFWMEDGDGPIDDLYRRFDLIDPDGTEFVEIWVTAAPAAYDYGGVTELDHDYARTLDGRQQFRLVAMSSEQARWQIPRYGSGLYYSAPLERFTTDMEWLHATRLKEAQNTTD